jgi:hypothetical protein
MEELNLKELERVVGGGTRQTVTITKDGPDGGTLRIINDMSSDGQPYNTATWTPNRPPK